MFYEINETLYFPVITHIDTFTFDKCISDKLSALTLFRQINEPTCFNITGCHFVHENRLKRRLVNADMICFALVVLLSLLSAKSFL